MSVGLWEVQTGKLRHHLAEYSGRLQSSVRSPLCIAFSPDGSALALICDGDGGKRTVRVYLQEGKLLTALLEIPDRGYSRWLAVKQRPVPLAFAPDGETIAIGSRVRNSEGAGGRVYLYRWRNETQSGEANQIEAFDELALRSAARVLDGHGSHVSQVTFLPGGHRLASGSDDGSLILWDLESGCMTQSIQAHTRAITSLGVSRSGHRMLTAGADGTVHIWALE
jgi:WD40 repeat protein